MTPEYAVQIGRETLFMTLSLAGPILGVGLVVGLLVAIFQAVTSVQEQTLSIIPKMLAVSVALTVLLPWMLSRLVSFTAAVFGRITIL